MFWGQFPLSPPLQLYSRQSDGSIPVTAGALFVLEQFAWIVGCCHVAVGAAISIAKLLQVLKYCYNVVVGKPWPCGVVLSFKVSDWHQLFTELHNTAQQWTTLHNIATTMKNTAQQWKTLHNIATTMKNTAQHCTTRNNTAQQGTTLQNTAQHCTTRKNTAQQYTAMHNTAQHCTIPHLAVKYCTALHCSELECSVRAHCAVLHCIVLDMWWPDCLKSCHPYKSWPGHLGLAFECPSR